MLGVILAGGESTRMGKDKATVEVAGRSMLEWVTAAVVEAGLEPVVAGRVEGPADVEAFPDPGVPHRGPLAGLVGAMHHHPDTPAVLVSVDQPWVRPATLRRLLEIGRRPAGGLTRRCRTSPRGGRSGRPRRAARRPGPAGPQTPGWHRRELVVARRRRGAARAGRGPRRRTGRCTAPSADSRARVQVRQNGRVTDAMTPTSPAPSR
jgi:hypothetical protein